MKCICECASFCTLRVEISDRDRELRFLNTGEKRIAIISNECEHGPSVGDKVISKGNGYTLYEEQG